MDPKAYHGLAGEFVSLVSPHSESDPVALLVQLLVVFGSISGHSAHFVIEGTRHFLNLFTVLVGQSSRGRKGTSMGRILELVPESAQEWKGERIQSGLSSGEGPIWAVRDSSEHMVRGKLVEEEGVSDKRLLGLEPEFASVLRVMAREGNTLSPTLRSAWDSGDLRIITKNSPAVSTGAHISVIGHVTDHELRRHLHSTEVGNGFGNRILWLSVRRSKVLPFGGNLDSGALQPLTKRFEDAVTFATRVSTVTMDSAAAALWASAYERLTDGRPGLLGSLTSRAEAQARRLACVYALLDGTSVVGRPHLEAALAIVEYVERSVEFIFGDSLGDPTADEILGALRAAVKGLSRTDIRDIFSRNRPVHEIERALAVLERANLAYREIVQTGGRPGERWFAGTATTKPTITAKGTGWTP